MAAGSVHDVITRLRRIDERPEADWHFFQTVWFHQLGKPIAADAYVIGREFPRIAEIELTGSNGTRVPVMILHARNIRLDGTHPTLLYAYGG